MDGSNRLEVTQKEIIKNKQNSYSSSLDREEQRKREIDQIDERRSISAKIDFDRIHYAKAKKSNDEILNELEKKIKNTLYIDTTEHFERRYLHASIPQKGDFFTASTSVRDEENDCYTNQIYPKQRRIEIPWDFGNDDKNAAKKDPPPLHLSEILWHQWKDAFYEKALEKAVKQGIIESKEEAKKEGILKPKKSDLLGLTTITTDFVTEPGTVSGLKHYLEKKDRETFLKGSEEYKNVMTKKFGKSILWLLRQHFPGLDVIKIEMIKSKENPDTMIESIIHHIGPTSAY